MQPIIRPYLDILFVGINGHPNNNGHYFNNNKTFWKLLCESGLTDKIINDEKILDYNFGIVNLVDRPTVSASELTKQELKEGAKFVAELIEKHRPKVVVSLGSLVYRKLTEAGIITIQVHFPTARVSNKDKLEALNKVREITDAVKSACKEVDLHEV